jgi:hypothetical protein
VEAPPDVVGEVDAVGLDELCVGEGLAGAVLVGAVVAVTQAGGGDAEALADADVSLSPDAWLEPPLAAAESVGFAAELSVALSVAVGHPGGVTAMFCIACAGMESRAPTATVPVATAPSSDIAGRRGFLMRRSAISPPASLCSAVLVERAPLRARVPP